MAKSIEAKDVITAVACVAVIGIAAWATVKAEEAQAKRPRRVRGDFWTESTERDRIQALETALTRERDPEVRKELAKQLGNARLELAA
jgi:hypothetical protein